MAYTPLKIPGIDTSQTYGGPTVAGFGKQPTPALATSATPYMNMVPQMPKPLVDTTAPIPAASLTSKATTYPAPVQQNVAATALASNLASSYSAAETGIQDAEAAAKTAANTPPAPADTGLKASLAKILGLSNDLAEKSGRAFEIQNEEGVFTKKKEALRLNNEILAKTKFYDKKIEEIRKNPQGKFGQAVEQDVANIERQRNSELADLAIQSKVANDDYKGAFDIAQAKVDAEFEPIQAQIDTLKTYYSLAQNDMTESEKLAAQTEIKKQEDELAFKREKELIGYRAAIDAASGAGGEGDADVIAYTAALQNGSATLAQIPQKLRGQVLANVQSTGTNKLLGLLSQYRDTVKGLNFFTANTPGNKALLNTLKGQITAVYKQQQQLGTLDNGVQTLVDRIIPDPSQLSISSLSNKAQIEAIDNFIKNQGGTPETQSDDPEYLSYLKAIGQ